MRRLRMTLCLLCLVTLFIAGCKKKTTTNQTNKRQAPKALKISKAGKSMLELLPKQAKDIFYIPTIGAIPPQLDTFLERFEGSKEGQVRKLVGASEQRFGINPLKLKEFSQAGFDTKGSLAVARVHVNKRPVMLLAIALSNASTFEAKLKSIAKEKLAVREFKKTTLPKGKGVCITAYGKNSFDQPVEEFAYMIKKKTTLLAVDLGPAGTLDPEAKVKHTTWSADALTFTLSLPSEKTLKTSETFFAATQHAGGAQLLHFTENQWASDAAAQKAALKRFSKNINLRRLLRQPQRLLQLRSRLPWNWSTTTVQVSPKSVRFGSFLRLPQSAQGLAKSLENKDTKPAVLLEGLHKDAVLAMKLSLKPKQLDALFRQSTKNLPVKAATVYEALKKSIGVDIPKDVLPNLTGQAIGALYGVNSKIVMRATRDPMVLPCQLHLGVVAEIKDPKKLIPVLEKLKATIKFGRRGATARKEDGVTVYRIPVPAWPGILAHWAVYKNHFIYSIGPEAFKLTLDALKNPKNRLFTPEQAGVLGGKNAGAVYLGFGRLKEVASSLTLSFGMRLFIASTLQKLRRVNGLTLSFGPTKTGLQLQGELRVR